jgi:adenosylcobinamide-phosphate synthase
MPPSFICVIAIVLDICLKEPRQWHPLIGFGTLAQDVERYFYGPPRLRASSRQLRGVLALFCLITPIALTVWMLSNLPMLGVLTGLTILYLSLGAASLADHAQAVAAALDQDDLTLARQQVGKIVSRDTADMDATQISAATVESVLENGCDAIFGALFWFIVAGAPGAVVYRLVNTLDAMWGYRTDHYRDFGRAAARLDDLLNWLPARLTGLSYMLLGNSRRAWQCWHTQAPTWKSPNAGTVMATGAGALGLVLGGGAYYQGEWQSRPPLGIGSPPGYEDIRRAIILVRRSLWLWLGIIIAVDWFI